MMRYESRRELCITCQYWTGERTSKPFIVEVGTNMGKCVVDFKNGPTRQAQHPGCDKYKKWDQIK